MKRNTKKGKIAAKKWVFGVEKIRDGNQFRKAKWCKMQVLFLKTDKTKGVKS